MANQILPLPQKTAQPLTATINFDSLTSILKHAVMNKVMNYIKIRNTLPVVLSVGSLFISGGIKAFAAQAGTTVQINPPGPIPNIGPSGLISFVINAFFAIGILAALIYLLWGGLNWILSGGDKEKIGAARARIIAAIVGLVMIVLAYFILDFVLKLLGMCGINNLVLPTLGGQNLNMTCTTQGAGGAGS